MTLSYVTELRDSELRDPELRDLGYVTLNYVTELRDLGYVTLSYVTQREGEGEGEKPMQISMILQRNIASQQGRW